MVAMNVPEDGGVITDGLDPFVMTLFLAYIVEVKHGGSIEIKKEDYEKWANDGTCMLYADNSKCADGGPVVLKTKKL